MVAPSIQWGCVVAIQSAITLRTLRLHDGYNAFARAWLPQKPRGAVLYLHGIQSHGGWYERSGAHLAEAGFAVLMPDRRGSGRNHVDRGHVNGGPQTWLRDVADGIAWLREQANVNAVHLVGVSWGGKLAAAAAASGVEGIESLTLIAPGIYPRIDLPMREKVKVAWSLLAEPNKRFAIPLNDPTLFTANPERINWVQGDDLKLLEVTGAFLLASRRLDRVAQRMPESRWRGPVHLLLAEHDRIIDNTATRDWFGRLLPPQHAAHRLQEYAGAHHTLEFEPDPEPMRRAVAEWLLLR